MGNPYEPKTAFYTPQTFSKEAKLAEMYGSQASRRDKRKFEKYWNSEQRYNDEDAFNKAETDKMFASADARFKEINDAYKARSMAQQAATAVTPQETPVQAPVQAPAPVQQATPTLRPRKTNAEWDAIGAQKFKDLGIDGAGTMADVRKIQELVGLTGDQLDGKWGDTTQKAYDAYQARQQQQQRQKEVQKNYDDAYLHHNQDGTRRDNDGTTYYPDGSFSRTFGNDVQRGSMVDGKPVWDNPTTVFNYLGYTPVEENGRTGYQNPRNSILYYDDGTASKDGRTGSVTALGDVAWDTPVEKKQFVLSDFAKQNQLKTKFYNGKQYARYNPDGAGDFWISEDGKIVGSDIWGGIAPMVDPYQSKGKAMGALSDLRAMLKGYDLPGYKKGGTMNRVNYFQQGGAAPQQDIQQQVVALVQAAMQGDKKATQTVNQIMEAAKAGDQQATQIAQMIQQVVQQMQGQATAARWGSKLNYIKSLKYAKGGKTCPACEQKVEMKKCGGKKAKKRYFGGYL